MMYIYIYHNNNDIIITFLDSPYFEQKIRSKKGFRCRLGNRLIAGEYFSSDFHQHE